MQQNPDTFPEGKPQTSHFREKDRPTLLVFHVNDSTDDQVLFQTACKMAKVPFVWHVTDSAEKAISYLKTLLKMNREHPAAWPDLVVLDLHMPGGSGFEVLEYIRSTPQLRRLPVVIFTGHPDPAYVKRAYELGANSFLLKPIEFQNTVNLVASLYTTMSFMQRPTLR